MRLIDADELLKDLYEWKKSVETNPYCSRYERIPKADTIDSTIDYVKEQLTIITWIPTEIALPEEEQYVLISMADGDISIAKIMWKQISESSKDYYWLTEFDRFIYKRDDVTAWMKLPQCYEEGKETE